MTRRSLKVLLSGLFLLCGCATPHHSPAFEKIRVGMSKEEVIQQLGKPHSIAVNGGTEYMEYQTYFHTWKPGDIGYERYFVRLVNGAVQAYGKVGDFDSTKNPTSEIKIDLKTEDLTKTKSNTQGPSDRTGIFDLRSELEHLDKMRKEGLITEEEFKELKKKAIDKAKSSSN